MNDTFWNIWFLVLFLMRFLEQSNSTDCRSIFSAINVLITRVPFWHVCDAYRSTVSYSICCITVNHLIKPFYFDVVTDRNTYIFWSNNNFFSSQPKINVNFIFQFFNQKKSQTLYSRHSPIFCTLFMEFVQFFFLCWHSFRF